MAQICEFLGKKPLSGNKVSHSNIKTRTRWNLNLVHKRYAVPELSRTVSVTLSTSAIRTIDKFGGLSQALTRHKPDGFSLQLQRLRRDIVSRKSGLKVAKKKIKSTPEGAAPQDPA